MGLRVLVSTIKVILSSSSTYDFIRMICADTVENSSQPAILFRHLNQCLVFGILGRDRYRNAVCVSNSSERHDTSLPASLET